MSTMTMSALMSALRSAGRQHLTASTVVARQPVTGSHVLQVHGYTQVIRRTVPTGSAITSTVFDVGGHEWVINCYPNGIDREHDGYTSLFLSGLSACGSHTARLEASVLDCAGKPWHTQTAEHRSFSNYEFWGWKDFVKNDDLDERQHRVDDCLTILCDLTLDGLPMRLRAVEVTAAPPPPRLDVADTIWSKQPTDVTVHAGGETFAAHRWVLAARSPVFKAELQNTATSGELHVDDVDAEVFKALLNFMYTEVLLSDWNLQQLQLEVTMAKRLLAAADRYGLEKLKLACRETLCRRVEMDSLATILALANRHGCPLLNEACMKFLSYPGNVKSFMATDGFERLKKDCPVAALEIVVQQLPSFD